MTNVYSQLELVDISKNSKKLDQEVAKSFGKILFDMLDKGIYPDVDLLISLKTPLVSPFLLQNYQLTDEQISLIREFSSPSSYKEVLNMAVKTSKNVIKDSFLEEDNQSFKGLVNTELTPNDVVKLLVKGSSFEFKESYDAEFLKKVVAFDEFPDSDRFALGFVIHSIVVSMNKNQEIGFSADEYKKLKIYVEDMHFEIDTDSEFKNYRDGRDFALSRVLYWGNYADDFSQTPTSEFMTIGINSVETKNALENTFKRVEKTGFNEADLRFFDKLRSEDETEPLFMKNFYNSIIKSWGEQEVQRVFNNSIPSIWDIDDLKTDNVDRLLKKFFFPKGLDSYFTTSLSSIFNKDLIDHIYTDARLNFIVNSGDWDSFHSEVSVGVNRNNELAVFDVLSRIFIYASENDLNLSRRGIPSKDLPWGQALSVLNNATPTIENIDKFKEIAFELKNAPKCFNFERIGTSLGFFSMDKEMKAGNISMFGHFIIHVLKDLPHTPDKFLALCALNDDAGGVIRGIEEDTLKSLHPEDLSLLLDMVSADSFKHIKGNENAMITTSENAFYKRKNFFSLANFKKSSFLFSNNYENQPVFTEFLLNSPNRVLDGDYFLKLLSTVTCVAGINSNWNIFAEKYQNKFPDFLKRTPENIGFINSIPNLSNVLHSEEEKKLSVADYKVLLGLNSMVEELDKKQQFDESLILKRAWAKVPSAKREKFIERYIDSESKDWKSVSLYLLECGPFKSRFERKHEEVLFNIFMRHPEDFIECQDFNKTVPINLISKALIDDKVEFSKTQIEYLFKSFTDKPLNFFSLNRTLKDNKISISKSLIIKDVMENGKYPEIIFSKEISNSLSVDIDKLKIFKNLVDNISVEKAITSFILQRFDNSLKDNSALLLKVKEYQPIIDYVEFKSLEKQYLFSVATKNMFSICENVESFFLDKLGVEYDKNEHIVPSNGMFPLVLLDLRDLSKATPESKDSLFSVMEIFREKGIDSGNNDLREYYSKSLDSTIYYKTIKGEGVTERFMSLGLELRSFTSNKLKDAFNENISYALSLMKKQKISFISIDNIVVPSDKFFDSVLNYMDELRNKRAENLPLMDLEKISGQFAKVIINGLSNDSFSTSTKEKIIHTVYMTDFCSKYGNSNCLTSTDYMLFLNKDLLDVVYKNKLKDKLENLFKVSDYLTEQPNSDSDNSFKL